MGDEEGAPIIFHVTERAKREAKGQASIGRERYGSFVMSRYIKVLSALAMVVALSGFTIGCNTMEGAGEDMKDAGREIEDAAD